MLFFRMRGRMVVLCGLVGAGMLCAVGLRAEFVALIADRDTTIYGNAFPETDPLSNGSGSHFLAGVTGESNDFEVRRALLAFDVAGNLPANALIESAVLQVTVSRAPPPATRDGREDPFFLHRALAPWGEGTSDPGGLEGVGAPATPGDATWLHSRYEGSSVAGLRWAAAGGDFVAAPSANLQIGVNGGYRFSAAQMTADVQGWLDDPSANHGWFLLGHETGDRTMRRFNTKDQPDAGSMPALRVTYSIIPEPATIGLAFLGVVWICVQRSRR